MQDITVLELKNRFQQPEEFLFLDVREPSEYNEFNIGAQLIPLGDVPRKLDDIEDWKHKEIIVHCRSGMRSASAKAILEQNGFTKVRNLTGGILAWVDAFGNVKP